MMALPAPAASKLDPKQIADTLRNLKRGETFHYSVRGQHFYAPRTAAELGAIKAAEPGIRILAGSTDVGLWVTKQFRDLGNLLYVGQVEDLNTVAERDGMHRDRRRRDAGATPTPR